uniref:VeA protein n=1 Tax=Arthroderma otae (strain ATCC MYA-4605 / CBS 113480) TaxID=554155 RepID=C5FEQ7_ARTOC|nr:veA protein [Microsporum canis CBS 113480]EEQ28381.1 veA protein [Microsporum canis CBS 113480]
MATKSSILHPPNETEHSSSRITREGKKITYSLRVMQQPERARACGAGAKSAADRRPVDPPPIVEMRIFESDPNNDMQKTDVTFSYNANFFLFATLEWARPYAHGRVQGQPTACPVLTGVPVAGIAYLDRPSQAGYFIFPDLSVRHEGLYRLNFSLYEEPKESKDEDKVPPAPVGTVSTTGMTMPMKSRQPMKSMYFRLEVKTVAFTVFSAKKFPGLSESTTLSRIVAEQGCRVRIRRDAYQSTTTSQQMPPPSSLAIPAPYNPSTANDIIEPATPTDQAQSSHSTSSSQPQQPTYDPTPGKGWSYRPEPLLSSKRGHSDVFGAAQHTQPLHHGKRADSIVTPSSSSVGARGSLLSRIARLQDLDDDENGITGMTYKRADGRVATRMAGPARVS